MKRPGFWLLISLLFLVGNMFSFSHAIEAEKKGEYLLPGNIKEGWKVFTVKKCSACHSIWGEGAKEGPDLGALPESYVSHSQLAALMWNHWPEMWGKWRRKKSPLRKWVRKKWQTYLPFFISSGIWMSQVIPGTGKP